MCLSTKPLDLPSFAFLKTTEPKRELFAVACLKRTCLKMLLLVHGWISQAWRRSAQGGSLFPWDPKVFLRSQMRWAYQDIIWNPFVWFFWLGRSWRTSPWDSKWFGDLIDFPHRTGLSSLFQCCRRLDHWPSLEIVRQLMVCLFACLLAIRCLWLLPLLAWMPVACLTPGKGQSIHAAKCVSPFPSKTP